LICSLVVTFIQNPNTLWEIVIIVVKNAKMKEMMIASNTCSASIQRVQSQHAGRVEHTAAQKQS